MARERLVFLLSPCKRTMASNNHKIFLKDSGFVLTAVAIGSAPAYSAAVRSVIECLYTLFHWPWKMKNLKNIPLGQLFKTSLELVFSMTISYNILKLLRRGFAVAEGIEAKFHPGSVTQDED